MTSTPSPNTYLRDVIATLDNAGKQHRLALDIINKSFAQFREPLLRGISRNIFQNLQATTTLTSHLALTLQPLVTPVPSLFESLPSLKLLNDSLSHLSEHLNAIMPSLIKYARISEQINKDAKVMNAGGYFLWEHWPVVAFQRYVGGIHQVPARQRNAVLTNVLLSITRADGFVELLEDCFLDSPMLQQRWPIVEQALEANLNRNYLLSIPTLLAQVEGVLVDALVMNETLCVKDYKVYRKSNGKELNGLKQIAKMVKQSEFQEDPRFLMFADYVIDNLTPERNYIMHGRKVDYGKASLSVKLVLYLWGLTTEISRYENPKVLAKATDVQAAPA